MTITQTELILQKKQSSNLPQTFEIIQQMC